MSRQTKVDAIDRALMHHQLAGAVHVYSPPERNGPSESRRSTWTVVFTGRTLEPVTMSTPTAEAVCMALAVAEAVYGAP